MLLEKMLQSQGFGSRKHCQQLIKSATVTVDGQLSIDLKTQIKPRTEMLFTVYGESYQYREKVYIALNKPQGYECSHQPLHHHSVFDLFPEPLLNRGLQCVGRLDQDTTGLLLLTDDGAFLQALTHPRKHVAKVYRVTTVDPVTSVQIETLQRGVELRNEKGLYVASDIMLLDENQLSLTIHQGVYHQVKRMLAAVGNKVQQLHRQQIGNLVLDDLAEGEWIYLTDAQLMLAKARTTQ